MAEPHSGGGAWRDGDRAAAAALHVATATAAAHSGRHGRRRSRVSEAKRWEAERRTVGDTVADWGFTGEAMVAVTKRKEKKEWFIFIVSCSSV
ncbi:hypothetical protein SESBI_38893 [Sesbania bispinosa]|nr:hypothetical protein SESBI_38893 [Sesbania bispinosa]